MTQRDLANLSGINASIICNLETGKALGPSEETVRRICAAVHATADDAYQLSVFAKFDRVEKSVKEQIPQQFNLLRAALDAAIVLTEKEQIALTEHLQKLVDSKRQFFYLTQS